MGREIAITVFLFTFRMIFSFFKLFPVKCKTVFVASFGTNILFTTEALEKMRKDEQVVILKTSQCNIDFGQSPSRTVLSFETVNLIDWIRSIYHLATSRNVFVDNYYAFLSITAFKPGTQCIQLWHAAGAIKQFGLKDLSIENRPAGAYKRFKKVYQRFDQVVVGSDNMAVIFCEGFGISKKRILRTGVPRTDFFFDSAAKKDAEEVMKVKFPVIGKKKVILYAPTYREHELNISSLHLDLEKMNRELMDEYILLLRVHPAVTVNAYNKYPDFVFDVSDYHHVNHLLVITDILITDYSSIPFEFSLLHKPMVFFAYDLEAYSEIRGFWDKYEELVPDPIVENTDDLIQTLKTGEFNMNRIKHFSNTWNQYSKGDSSKRLIETLYFD